MNSIKVSIYIIVIFTMTAKINGSESDHKCNETISEKISDGVYYNYTVTVCCPGYNEDDNGICMPSCRYPCKRGFCKAPDVCGCRNGYELKNNECFPICESKCVDGYCIKPNVCGCPRDFILDANNSTLCVPICNPKCQQFSICTKSIPPKPNRCQCIAGYAENKKTKICEPVCKNKCTNSFCSAPDTCSCYKGYELDNSNKTNCKPKCELICPEFSSCIAPNKCECNDNYKNNTFTNKCDPICKNLIDNAKCIQPPNIWECNVDYQHDLKIDKCVLESCICKTNGYCLEHKDKCICYEGFVKNTTTGQCEAICQPKCENSICIDNNVCECLDGYHKTAEDHICEENELCSGHPCVNGECLITGECKCRNGYIKSLSYDGHIQCDKELSFLGKIMTSIIGVPLLLASCILLVVYVIAKKKSYNVEEQEMMLIGRH